MSKPFKQRYPATEKQFEIVKKASTNPKHLVGQENEKMRFFNRCGARLELSESDAMWLEIIGKKMGLIESTAKEKEQFFLDAEQVRSRGGRNSSRYQPSWKRSGRRR